LTLQPPSVRVVLPIQPRQKDAYHELNTRP
jgi:hypothetical protein